MPRKRKDIIALLDQAVAQRTPVLEVSNANVDDLMDRVCQMNWLVELRVTRCHLHEVPDAIANSAGLTRLVLRENKLRTLPEAIGSLGRLEQLDLAENSLHTLPDAIGNLGRLERLVLSQNSLTGLPDGIARLPALRHLDLQRHSWGYEEFSISAVVTKWLETVPEVIWLDGKPPKYEPPVAPFSVPDHPNVWLLHLKEALDLCNVASAMDDRKADGNSKRREAGAIIRRVFSQVRELEDLLPEFYQDFQRDGFYSSHASEKTLDANPFRLPTKADDAWLAGNLPPAPLRLEGEINGSHRIVSIIRPNGEKTKVGSFEHGPGGVGNMPYAPDEAYWADCEAWLYQAGPKRFYLRVVAHAYGSGTEWLGSDDGGSTWEKQPTLSCDWLEKNRGSWRELDHLPLTREREDWMKLHPL